MPIDSISNTNPGAVLMLEQPDAIALELGGDLDAELAVMLLKQADESREMTHQARDAVEKRLSYLEEEQVTKLREKAAETRRAAEVEGFTTMVGGAATVYGGVVGLAAGDDEDLQHTATVAKGGAEFGAGVGKLDAARHNFGAADADADATAADHRAAEAKRELEQLGAEEQDARQLGRTALEMLAETNRTRAAAYQAALFQRA
jgi:hypothetical protein